VKIFVAMFFWFLSFQAFGDVSLKIHGVNDEVLERSPAGILVGVKFSDGVIVNPSFTLDELKNGVVEKNVVEENRSVVSCTYNWLFAAKADDFAPRNFQGVADGICKTTELGLVIESPANVRKVEVTVMRSAFDRVSASRLLVTGTAEDSIGSSFPQKIKQISIDQTPLTYERTFVQIANSELNFVLQPLWIRNGGNVQGDRILFQENQYILE